MKISVQNSEPMRNQNASTDAGIPSDVRRQASLRRNHNEPFICLVQLYGYELEVMYPITTGGGNLLCSISINHYQAMITTRLVNIVHYLVLNKLNSLTSRG